MLMILFTFSSMSVFVSSVTLTLTLLNEGGPSPMYGLGQSGQTHGTDGVGLKGPIGLNSGTVSKCLCCWIG